MTDNLKENFINALIEKTNSKSLTWNKFNYTVSVSENRALYQKLMDNKNYHVVSSESYFSNTKQGSIYLIYVLGENSSLGYSLYIQENINSPLYQINSDNLNSLSIAIRNNENDASVAVNKFIDNFLSNP